MALPYRIKLLRGKELFLFEKFLAANPHQSN